MLIIINWETNMAVLTLGQPVLEIAICGKSGIRVRWASLAQVRNLELVSQRWGTTKLVGLWRLNK